MDNIVFVIDGKTQLPWRNPPMSSKAPRQPANRLARGLSSVAACSAALTCDAVTSSAGYESDPLLKVGTGAMVVALGFALVVAVAASIDGPMEVAAASRRRSEPPPGRSSAPTPASTRGWRGTYPRPNRKSRPNRQAAPQASSPPKPDDRPYHPEPASVPNRQPSRNPPDRPEQPESRDGRLGEPAPPLPSSPGRHHGPHHPLPRSQERPRHGLGHEERPEQGRGPPP